MHIATSPAFKQNARQALADPGLQKALARSGSSFVARRAAAVANLPEFEQLRDIARDIKNHTLAHLDFYLEEYEARVKAAGGKVHWCATAEEARAAVLDICRLAGAKTVTKGKSMISEELDINDHLERNGIHPVETDLGEYILQLRHEVPSHIIAPAFHLNREDWEAQFRASHTDLPPDRVFHERRDILTEARAQLRQQFFAADVGITGANFLIAETGSSVIVTNEGNGDLTQTLPRVHVVLASIEKLVPTIEDCTSMLRVLARSATGQDFSVYTTFSTGARRAGDLDGPDEYHVILLDNGRSAMLGTEFQDMLRCIRCAACMNHCPVYGAVGGHAYGWVYPGPMGSVLTPALIGVDQAALLPNASTFCGKCESVCPVKIPLPGLMRHWREREFERHLTPATQRRNLALWAWAARRPALYRSITRAGRVRPGIAGTHAAAGSPDCRLPADGPPAAICPRPKATPSSPATRARNGKRGVDEPNRNPGRDQARSAARSVAGRHRGHAACAAGRASTTPDTGALARAPAEQVKLFIANVEKEFGTRCDRAGSRPRAGRAGRLSGGAEPARRIRHGAAPRAARHQLVSPTAAAGPRGTRGCIRYRQPATRFRRNRRDRHADAALRAGATDHAQSAARDRDRAVARQSPGRSLRRSLGPAARRIRPDAAKCHAGHRAIAIRRYRADAGARRAWPTAIACAAGDR